jgi:hypothetical protein
VYFAAFAASVTGTVVEVRVFQPPRHRIDDRTRAIRTEIERLRRIAGGNSAGRPPAQNAAGSEPLLQRQGMQEERHRRRDSGHDKFEWFKFAVAERWPSDPEQTVKSQYDDTDEDK